MTSIASSKLASRHQPRLSAVLAAFALLLGATSAHPRGASDSPIAETLFRDGKALMKVGDYAKACPKLAESQRLDPASGTMLALALCHEKEGKIASAWAEYLEADALARKDGRQQRSKAARLRAAALEPKLSHLEIVVPDETRELAGLEIRLDGVLLAEAVWGTPMPVDPGEHAVEATATNKEPWKGTVTIAKPAERQQIEIGALIDLPPEPETSEPAPEQVTPPPRPDQPDDEGSNALLITGAVLGGIGVAALGVGTIFGIRALDQIGEAQDRCTPELCTDPQAVELNEDGATSADLSTGLLIGGGVAAATGLVLILTAVVGDSDGADADAASHTALRVQPLLGRAGGAVTLGGRW